MQKDKIINGWITVCDIIKFYGIFIQLFYLPRFRYLTLRTLCNTYKKTKNTGVYKEEIVQEII